MAANGHNRTKTKIGQNTQLNPSTFIRRSMPISLFVRERRKPPKIYAGWIELPYWTAIKSWGIVDARISLEVFTSGSVYRGLAHVQMGLFRSWYKVDCFIHVWTINDQQPRWEPSQWKCWQKIILAPCVKEGWKQLFAESVRKGGRGVTIWLSSNVCLNFLFCN